MRLQEPRGWFARWMVEVQSYEFVVKYTPRTSIVVPDSLSRDATEKPLSQRCPGEIEASVDSDETAGAIEESGLAVSLLMGSIAEEIRKAQENECAEERKLIQNGRRGKCVIDRQGLLCTKS